MSGRYWDAQLETLPVERRRLLHEHRLHWQVRRCWDASPFYRARLEAAGLDPATFGGLAEWPRLPLLHLGDLPPASGAGEPSPDWSVAPEVWWQAREGGAGTPARILTDGDVVQRADLAARALWAAGGRAGATLVITGQDASLPQVGTVTDTVAAGARRIGMTVYTDPPSAREDAQRPLTVNVSIAANADDAPRETGDSAPDLSWATTWPPRPPLDGDGSPVSGAVALTHVTPTIAYACGESAGVHWADDHHLIEIVDAQTGVVLGPDVPGALVVTELAREGSPLLRFWTGLEAVRSDEPCPCGRTSARSPFVRRLA